MRSRINISHSLCLCFRLSHPFTLTNTLNTHSRPVSISDTIISWPHSPTLYHTQQRPCHKTNGASWTHSHPCMYVISSYSKPNLRPRWPFPANDAHSLLCQLSLFLSFSLCLFVWLTFWALYDCKSLSLSLFPSKSQANPVQTFKTKLRYKLTKRDKSCFHSVELKWTNWL